jgi:Porin subfamily
MILQALSRNQPSCPRLQQKNRILRDMALGCRLSSGLAALALVIGPASLALAQGNRGSVGEHKINRCSIYGPDFVAIEGTDACARVGGHIRVELGVGNGLRSSFNRSDADGARPAALNSGQNIVDPPFDARGDSRGHLRVHELPGSRDLFAR